MSKPEVTTGDDVVLLHTLKKTNSLTGVLETFNVPNTATVTSRIISSDHDQTYSSAITQVDSTTGADWANSKIAVVFDSDTTNEILNNGSVLWKKGKVNAKLETQVDDGGKLTFFASMIMVKGSIS